jgi:hypothetical protein
MIRLFGLTIMRSSTHDAYSDVVRAAWPLVWTINFDQDHDYAALMYPNLNLASALSYAPIEDAPK